MDTFPLSNKTNKQSKTSKDNWKHARSGNPAILCINWVKQHCFLSLWWTFEMKIFVFLGQISTIEILNQAFSNNGIVHVCPNGNITLPWNVNLSPTEQIISVEWYFHGRYEHLSFFIISMFKISSNLSSIDIHVLIKAGCHHSYT